MNFRHQVHIGHNDEIDQLNNANKKLGTHEQEQQQQHSNSVKQQH